MKRFRYLLLVLLTLVSLAAEAQSKSGDSLMRSSGRIYVVIAVLVTILVGLILYMVGIDRRLSRLEKETDNQKG